MGGARKKGKKSGSGGGTEPTSNGADVTTCISAAAVLCLLAAALFAFSNGGSSSGPSRAELAAAARPQRRGELVGPANAGDELLTWARETDGFVTNVVLKQFKEGRGLATKMATKKGDIMLFVPDEYMIQVNTSNIPENVSRYSTVAAKLLMEADKGEASVHWHFIRGMPSVENVPHNLPSAPESVKELNRAFSEGFGSRRAVVQQRITDGLGCAEDTLKLLQDSSLEIIKTSPNIAEWACSIVMSREFTASGGSAGGQLWPIHDMKNNNINPGKIGYHIIRQYKGISGRGLQADRSHKKGEQIYEHCEAHVVAHTTAIGKP